jgi:hypothetical protein
MKEKKIIPWCEIPGFKIFVLCISTFLLLSYIGVLVEKRFSTATTCEPFTEKGMI